MKYLKNSYRLLGTTLFVVVVGLLTGQIMGCATMAMGRYNEISISTTPANATILDDSGNVLAVTPAKLTIKKNEEPMLRFVKDGFQDTTVVIGRSPSLFYVMQMAMYAGWYFMVPADGKTPLNWAAAGGLYGGFFYIIDRMLGGAWEYKPEYRSGNLGNKKKIEIQMKN